MNLQAALLYRYCLSPLCLPFIKHASILRLNNLFLLMPLVMLIEPFCLLHTTQSEWWPELERRSKKGDSNKEQKILRQKWKKKGLRRTEKGRVMRERDMRMAVGLRKGEGAKESAFSR